MSCFNCQKVNKSTLKALQKNLDRNSPESKVLFGPWRDPAHNLVTAVGPSRVADI
jgi:hypothetical protein